MDRHYFSALVCSAFIISSVMDPTLQAGPYTTESVQSGAWTDLSRFENRVQFSLDSTLVSVYAFACDQRSSTRESAWVSGLSIEERWIGTRVVYGPLRAVGLPSRLTDPLGKTLSAGYGRLRSDYRPDTGATGPKPSSIYASFSPKLPAKLELSLGLNLEMEHTLSGIASFGIIHANDRRLRTDLFAAKAKFPSRMADAWFSTSPPLPRREQELFAISTSAAIPYFSTTFDFAWSNQDFSGKGWYFGGTTSARMSQVTVDLAMDYTTTRFTDTVGTSRGAGLRAFIETRLKNPNSSIALGIDMARYDSLSMKDTAKLKFAYIPSEVTGGNRRKLHPNPPFGLTSLTTGIIVSEADTGLWFPSFQFHMHHISGKTNLSEKFDFELSPNTFALAFFSFGLNATVPFEIDTRSKSGLAGLNGNIAIKKPAAESALLSCSVGFEWKIRNGRIQVSIGTDDSVTAETVFAPLFPAPKSSNSAFGPWTVRLGWRFEERRPTPILIRQ